MVWSFFNFLQQQEQEEALQLAAAMKSTVDTLRGLVEVLRVDASSGQTTAADRDQKLDAFIIQNHPIFDRIARITNTKYRVFFTNLEEMEKWLSARQWSLVTEESWDSKNTREYINGNDQSYRILFVSNSLFNQNGQLNIMLPQEWNDKLVRVARQSVVHTSSHTTSKDDDIPF